MLNDYDQQNEFWCWENMQIYDLIFVNRKNQLENKSFLNILKVYNYNCT